MEMIKLNDAEKKLIQEMIDHLSQSILDLKMCIKGSTCMKDRLDLGLDTAWAAASNDKIRDLKYHTFNCDGKRNAVPVDAELVVDPIVTPAPRIRLSLPHVRSA